MSHDDSNADLDAMLADLLSGEIDVDSEQGRALLEKAGMPRSEFDRMRQVADALEFGAVSKLAAADTAPGNARSATELLLEASGNAVPRRSPMRLLAPLVAMAAAILLIVVIQTSNSSGAGDSLPDTLGGEAATPQSAPLEISSEHRVLTIPHAFRGEDTVKVTFERAGEDGEWVTIFTRESEVRELRLKSAEFALLEGPGALRVRFDLDSPDVVPPTFWRPLQLR